MPLQGEEASGAGTKEPWRGTSGTAGDARQRQVLVVRRVAISLVDSSVIRPRPGPKIKGRLVTEHKLIKFLISRTGDPKVRCQVTTVTRMYKTLQERDPTYYNISSNNFVTTSGICSLVVPRWCGGVTDCGSGLTIGPCWMPTRSLRCSHSRNLIIL